MSKSTMKSDDIISFLIVIVIGLILLYLGAGLHLIDQYKEETEKSPYYWLVGLSLAFMGANILTKAILSVILPEKIQEDIRHTQRVL